MSADDERRQRLGYSRPLWEARRAFRKSMADDYRRMRREGRGAMARLCHSLILRKSKALSDWLIEGRPIEAVPEKPEA